MCAAARSRIVNQPYECRVFVMVDDVYFIALYYLYVSYTMLMLFKSTDGESTVRNVFK